LKSFLFSNSKRETFRVVFPLGRIQGGTGVVVGVVVVVVGVVVVVVGVVVVEDVVGATVVVVVVVVAGRGHKTSTNKLSLQIIS